MTTALPPIDVRPDQWQIVCRILQRHVPGYAVWAFGSRATGTAKPYSDLDLAVIGDRPLPLSVRAALAEAFSQSELPWKVDIVDWATADDAFRRIIDDSKIMVQRGRREVGHDA